MSEVVGSINDRSFAQANDVLNSSFKFCLLDNADAAYLVALLDDLIYECLTVIDNECSLVQQFYMNLVYHAQRKETKKTFSTLNDMLAPSYAHVVGCDMWLYAVRKYVRIYRAYWTSFLDAVMEQLPSLRSQLDAQLDRPLDDRGPVQLTVLGVTDSLNYYRAYSIINTLSFCIPRIQDVDRRISVPFLRRVGTLARNFSREPEIFMDHYQHGYEGVTIALSKYDSEFGSFASQVNMWVNNRMIHSIKQTHSFIRIPDRMYKMRVLVDRARKRNPNITLEEVAQAESVDVRTLELAVSLHDRQNIATLIDDLDDEPEAYTDLTLEQDKEAVDLSQQLDFYTSELTQQERLLLYLFYDYESIDTSALANDPDVLRESFRQLSAVLG
jgi:DNA-directed RNA polymerase specialized sigma subunit